MMLMCEECGGTLDLDAARWFDDWLATDHPGEPCDTQCCHVDEFARLTRCVMWPESGEVNELVSGAGVSDD